MEVTPRAWSQESAIWRNSPKGYVATPSTSHRRNHIGSKIGRQYFRNYHGAIGLLIIFQNCDPRPAHGQSRSVQRVDEFGPRFAVAPEADLRAARLKGFAIRAGRDFAVSLLARQPDFDVVSL